MLIEISNGSTIHHPRETFPEWKEFSDASLFFQSQLEELENFCTENIN